MKKIIVIVGPTGVGKTKLSVSLAKMLNGEIINADSMQVYQGLDIGTAKVKECEKEGVPHHLFDICSPTFDYNIYNYQSDARSVIDDILKRGKCAILVGGSGLYIKSALYNYQFQDEKFHSEFTNMTNEELKQEIAKYYETNIHVNNRKRLVRELNKIRNNNQICKTINEKMYDFVTIGLTSNREKLYDVINKRVDKMVSEGLVEEVLALYKNNIYSKAIMTGIGYKELYRYFDKELSLEESLDLIRKNSRNFAKRQWTFFNHQMDVKWFNVNFDDFDKTIQEVYDYVVGN